MQKNEERNNGNQKYAAQDSFYQHFMFYVFCVVTCSRSLSRLDCFVPRNGSPTTPILGMAARRCRYAPLALCPDARDFATLNWLTELYKKQDMIYANCLSKPPNLRLRC